MEILLLTDDKKIDKVDVFLKYKINNWERIFDWREKVKNLPTDARGLGAIESH